MPCYHVWFSTKNRKWLLQGEIAESAKEFIKQAATIHGIRLIECETIVDHTHLLIEVQSRRELSKALNILKGVSARRMFERFTELKMDGGVNNLWQHRYGAKEVPPAAISSTRRYIETQWERLEKYER